MIRRRVAVAVLLAVLSSGCGMRGLNFKADERLTITSPADRAEIRLPLTVTWTTRDFTVTEKDGTARPDAGYFGVYVDRAPQPPGETQEWIARDDERCESTPGCPDEMYLAQRNVHSTSDSSFVIDRLPQPSTNAPERREFHEVTIVLLNGKGERIGESAFIREFQVNRDT